MSVRGAVLGLFLAASFVSAADLQTLKGEKITGDIVRISDKEIVIKSGDKEVSTPVPQVLRLEFPDHARVRLEDAYSDIELSDGTLLHCKEYKIKGKQVEAVTASGLKVAFPLAAVANILNGAADEKVRKEWSDRLHKKHKKDVLAVLREGIVNPVEGTLGEGSEDGKEISFRLGDSERNVVLEKVHGLIFLREIDPTAQPVLCNITDTHGDLIVTSALEVAGTNYNITTPSGVKLTLPSASAMRLDYSSDKVIFLSQVEPAKVDQPDEPDKHYRRDRNLDDKPLAFGGEIYPIGLALHAHTELEYDLKGDYREFRARAGIDSTVPGFNRPVVLKIEGDGKELFTRNFNRKTDTKPVPITLNIKDVQRLRIIVTSPDGFDWGLHLDLAEAKVSK
jgi:hypothetical protein